ncbi:MAG: NAD(P)H-hydrate epimerase [Phycisphaerae bacterium]|nr:NAD(P)H-hydrate epimerase [Phycisphaerae bacterium]
MPFAARRGARYRAAVRAFTRAEAQAFDRFAIETLGIPGIVLMENAALGCTEALRELAGTAWPTVRVAIVCGPGSNGGDGYAVARLLRVAGAEPIVHCFGRPRAGSDAAINAAIVEALGIPVAPPPLASAPMADLLVDALFGTGLSTDLDGDSRRIVERMNEFRGPRLAVDLPSGLDCDRGEPLGAAVRATVTATMAAPKAGFAAPGASAFTGRVVVVPIGAPVDARRT